MSNIGAEQEAIYWQRRAANDYGKAMFEYGRGNLCSAQPHANAHAIYQAQ